ncbi:hypothetical protein FACS189444_7030 [Spirochaetia bacterium]|nr:hypothetical protein FACS189444_7030 [Spirochaetia bacterium]
MKDVRVTIRFETSLKQKVDNLAKVERRSLADQAGYLLEKGLLIQEHLTARRDAGVSEGRVVGYTAPDSGV